MTEKGGIPVTTVSRTIFDLAAALPLEAVERAMRLAAGFRIMHVTWRHLHESPAEIASDLRLVLGSR